MLPYVPLCRFFDYLKSSWEGFRVGEMGNWYHEGEGGVGGFSRCGQSKRECTQQFQVMPSAQEDTVGR